MRTIICVCVVLFRAAAPAVATEVDRPHELIVYGALRPDNWDLYLFEEPDSPPRRLTDDPRARLQRRLLARWAVRRFLFRAARQSRPVRPRSAGGWSAAASHAFRGARRFTFLLAERTKACLHQYARRQCRRFRHVVRSGQSPGRRRGGQSDKPRRWRISIPPSRPTGNKSHSPAIAAATARAISTSSMPTDRIFGGSPNPPRGTALPHGQKTARQSTSIPTARNRPRSIQRAPRAVRLAR